MKKIIKLMAVVLLACLLATSVFAEEYVDPFVDGIGEIVCPKGTPTIDGEINTAEGWSAPQRADDTNTDGAWGGEEVRIAFDLYRAWDENGLYFAADIIIPELILCTGEDDIDATAGWNGDVFILTLDPMSSLLNVGMASEAAPWYCVGLFENNLVKMYRTQINEGDITEKVKLGGAKTDAGWRFEAFIPWEIICKDIYDISYEEVSLTPAELAKAGNTISAAVIYQDRFFDPEAEEIVTYSRYITIAKTLPDGSDGTLSSGWYIKAFGISLKLTEDAGTGDSSADNNNSQNIGESGTGNNAVDSGTAAGAEKVGTNAAGKGSTTKAQGTSAAKGTASAQTFDMGIAVSVGALAVSVIGIMASKKRK